MSKRRTHDATNRYDAEDNPIGLTGAFAPVKGAQSVDYDVEDDPVGLTQAFGAVSADDESRSWNEEEKWKDFDWDAALGEPVGDYSNPDDDKGAPAKEGASSGQSELVGAEGAGKPDGGARPAGADTAGQQRASEAAPVAAPVAAEPRKSGPKHGRHAAPVPELSPRMKKSQRTRRVLIVLVVLLIVVLAALGFFVYRTFSNSQQEAAQQAQEQVTAPKNYISDAPTDDAIETTARLASVPDLTRLLGMKQDEAIAALGRGALVTANREVNEEGNPIKVNLNVALTEEAADTKTGTPTVYLGVGEDGGVRQAGYSASASALGFGSLSFADAVNNEHVVEKTLGKIGVVVPEGSAVLPANKDEYSTYASDGTTVVRERCSFEGDVDVNGVPCTWSAVLSYDYTTQVVTGNLSDTVRIIYVYVTMK